MKKDQGLQNEKWLSLRLLTYMLQSGIFPLVRQARAQERVGDKRRTTTKKVQGFAVKMAFAALCVSLLLLGPSQAHAGTSAFVGSFTLTQPTQWGETLLMPGSYTISIASNTTPTI